MALTIRVTLAAVAIFLVRLLTDAHSATGSLADVNPDDSGAIEPYCPAPCPSGGSGGRVHNLASSPAHPGEIYAASELGGLFKSSDGGLSWSHLDGHLPTKTWDVAVDPGGVTVYATSFYDGRVSSLSGIEVSHDAGVTWTHPASATPPPGLCGERRSQPSGFGIAIRPGAPNEVLAGTNCGLARSTDAGATWTFVDPTPADGEAKSVWDVAALAGGLTYACGQEGVVRSPDGSTGWRQLPDPADGTGTYRGYCSIAADSNFPNVVVVVFSRVTYFDPVFDVRETAYFASFDGGNHWTAMPHPDGAAQKRVPMVTTNRRSYGIDIWVGAGNLFRIPCSLLGIVPVCPVTTRGAWAGTFSDASGDFLKAHGDSGDVLFDPSVSVDACPRLYSSDGGIYRNTSTAAPACHDPAFTSANVGLHAELLLGMAGSHRRGRTAEDVYMATQDIGAFGTTNAGATPPAWTHGLPADVFDVVADGTQVIVDDGALVRADPGLTNLAPIPNAPPPARQFFTVFTDTVDQFGARSYVLATRSAAGSDVVYTTNLSSKTVQSASVTWRSLAWPTAQAGIPCGVQAAVTPRRGRGATRFFVQSGDCLWRSRNQLWTIALGGRTRWTRLDVNGPCPTGGFGIFAVDPRRPNRLYASCTGTSPPRMVRSEDGGSSWQVDQGLTDLMTGGGVFVPSFADLGDGASFGGVQPVMVTFDPGDKKTLIAGGYESGVFLSRDGGATWSLLSDALGTSAGMPHLPRPFYAYFDHEGRGAAKAIYIGSVGRGVWRVSLPARRGS
jgi:hypothetical protein